MCYIDYSFLENQAIIHVSKDLWGSLESKKVILSLISFSDIWVFSPQIQISAFFWPLLMCLNAFLSLSLCVFVEMLCTCGHQDGVCLWLLEAVMFWWFVFPAAQKKVSEGMLCDSVRRNHMSILYSCVIYVSPRWESTSLNLIVSVKHQLIQTHAQTQTLTPSTWVKPRYVWMGLPSTLLDYWEKHLRSATDSKNLLSANTWDEIHLLDVFIAHVVLYTWISPNHRAESSRIPHRSDLFFLPELSPLIL